MRTILIAVIATILSGCATLFKGYESDLVINDAPPDLTVQTDDGITLWTKPGSKTIKRTSLDGSREYQSGFDPSVRIITLRSGKEYLLHFKSGDKESRVKIYPKLDAGWLILDILCGGIPALIDMYLGTWMYYDPVEYLESTRK